MKGFCIDVKTTLERYSDQLYLLSVSVTDGHPKASLPSAGQLQLRPDAKVGFLQAVPRVCSLLLLLSSFGFMSNGHIHCLGMVLLLRVLFWVK